MPNPILGLHHVTAIASDAQRNLDFYTQVLGLRFVKRTVNFDDPGTYHLYFGDDAGSPGTILTFFPWPRASRATPEPAKSRRPPSASRSPRSTSGKPVCANTASSSRAPASALTNKS